MATHGGSTARRTAFIWAIGVCLLWLQPGTPIAAPQQAAADETTEQSVQSVAAEFGLSAQERLTLQPVINGIMLQRA